MRGGARRRQLRWRVLTLAFALSAAGVLPVDAADVQTPAPMGGTAQRAPAAGALPVRTADVASSAVEPGSSQPQAAPRYRVVVDAPAQLKDVLERIVGLIRWQDYAEMTDELLDRLAREAIDETRNAAAADGYFAAAIEVTIDRGATPLLVTLKVEPGTPTRVGAARIAVAGPATTDVPLGTEAIARLRRDWGLKEGETFRQSTWAAAKQSALATLAASPYAAARIERSEAAIDPDAARAELDVELASGPAFRFGRLEISGLKKYAPSVARNYSTFALGEPYSESVLDRYVRRLNASGYFASVQAKIDLDAVQPEEATVFVAVIEAPTKRFEGGLGYSTDVQYRANANYRDVNFDGHGLQLYVDGRYESKIQAVTVRFSHPPNDRGWIATFGAAAERTDIEGLVTRTAAIGTRWHTVVEQDERAVSATYYYDEQLPSGAPTQTANALYAEIERYWRRVDDLIAPSSGWMASTHAGGGVPGVSTRGFGRVLGRFAWWLPLDRSNEVQVRAEGGAVFAGSRDGVPSKLLFRTGGDTTVRGYAFESLGVKDGDAVVPGRYYAVASVDAIHWMSPAWGLAAFVDAGNAVDALSDAKLAFGYGAGARVRTPLGPLRLDVAYGQDSHDVRVHFSVGLSF